MPPMCCSSHPSRVRGLKHIWSSKINNKAFRTHRGCVDWNSTLAWLSSFICFAPIAGAWIEMIWTVATFATVASYPLDLLHKSLLAIDTSLTKVNKTVLLQEVYYVWKSKAYFDKTKNQGVRPWFLFIQTGKGLGRVPILKMVIKMR